MAEDGLFQSVIAIITGSFITLLLLRYLGETMDRITSSFGNAGLFDVSDKWIGSMDTMFDLFYLACWTPFLITVVYSYMNVRRKRTETQMSDFEGSYY